jgi:hypothetical protein
MSDVDILMWASEGIGMSRVKYVVSGIIDEGFL